MCRYNFLISFCLSKTIFLKCTLFVIKIIFSYTRWITPAIIRPIRLSNYTFWTFSFHLMHTNNIVLGWWLIYDFLINKISILTNFRTLTPYTSRNFDNRTFKWFICAWGRIIGVLSIIDSIGTAYSVHGRFYFYNFKRRIVMVRTNWCVL